MAWTQTDIDKLRAAIATGALSVRYADKSVTYRSLAEMKDLLALMEACVNGANAPSRVRIAGTRGWR